MTATLERTGRTEVLRRRIRWIVAATIAYNVIEAVVAISSGVASSSTALVGFGLDSVVEVLSAAAVAWQFTRKDPEKYEKATLRVIALSFFALAAYVIVSALLTIGGVLEPEHSTVGLVLTAVSVVVMPAVSLLERRTGRLLGCGLIAATPEGRQTRYELADPHLAAAIESLMDVVLTVDEGSPCADDNCTVEGCC